MKVRSVQMQGDLDALALDAVERALLRHVDSARTFAELAAECGEDVDSISTRVDKLIALGLLITEHDLWDDEHADLRLPEPSGGAREHVLDSWEDRWSEEINEALPEALLPAAPAFVGDPPSTLISLLRREPLKEVDIYSVPVDATAQPGRESDVFPKIETFAEILARRGRRGG